MSGWVCVCASDHVLSDSLVTHASFLILPNPSCTGQPMERASISARSPAFLLDTQVGTALSFATCRSPHLPLCWLSPLCVFLTLPGCHGGRVHFHMWLLHMLLVQWCSVFRGEAILFCEGGGFCVAFHVIQTDCRLGLDWCCHCLSTGSLLWGLCWGLATIQTTVILVTFK